MGFHVLKCSDAHLYERHLVVLRLGKVLEGYGAVTLGLGAMYMNMFTTHSTYVKVIFLRLAYKLKIA